MADINPNAITGLASGMDTKSIVNKMIDAEMKKVQPVIERKETKQLELDAWKQVKTQLEKVKGSAQILSKKNMWEGKIVDSSNPDVVEAIATSGAKPGKHTIVVDKLALNHQIASQGFSEKDNQIGKGTVTITIGEEEPKTIIIDETNNTLQGLVDTIEKEEVGANASLIKTGNKEKPYQVVLTSAETGLAGEIQIKLDLKGEEESPTFAPYYTQPTKWKGIVEQVEQKQEKKVTGTGASTAVPMLVGDYQGTEPLDLTFTVVSDGIVGETESIKIRWEDNNERFGYVDVGSFSYAPGDAIPIVDGIALAMSDGEILVNDTFTAAAKNKDSELFWWKSAEDKAASITQPVSWGKQITEGGPVITGDSTSEEDDVFTLTVSGNGKIGDADNLQINYESENGIKGNLFVGKGYVPGTKLSLGQGLEFSLKPGILTDGSISSFEYQGDSTANLWWLDKEEQLEGGQIKNVTNWDLPEEKEEEAVGGFAGLQKAGLPSSKRLSNVEAKITGVYNSFDSKTYTFTAMGTGKVGVTKDLALQWKDSLGNEGVLQVGSDFYKAGEALAFDSGLSLTLGEGEFFDTDSFSMKTYTTVIQPPQDAEVRLGATATGGGLVITSSSNDLNDVIDGVKLKLLKTSEEPVVISIRGDTEKAIQNITDFTTAYNEMLTFFQEMGKYDKDKDAAGPLQGDRNLPRIHAETNKIFIDTVRGLDIDSNQLLTIGLKINKAGLIDLDEEKLNNAVADDLGRVADLFRSYGRIENTGISYLTSSVETDISGEEGFEIDITTAAAKGRYESPKIDGTVKVSEGNQEIKISVNGRASEEMKIPIGEYNIVTLVPAISRLIHDDKFLGKMNLGVTQSDGKLVIRSNVTGSKSKAEIIHPPEGKGIANFLTGGEVFEGIDVQGKIDGFEMTGTGQILIGAEDTPYEGLKLFVSLTDNQVSDAAEGNMVFTKGVGTKVQEYIASVLKTETGALGVYTKNVEDQLESYEKEVIRLNERVESKREKLNAKFARMEGKLGQLKSEQNYLTNQLSKL